MSSKELVEAIRDVANAITPLNAAGVNDSNGGYISSLTEAVLSASESIGRLASAVQAIADAMEAR